MDLDGHIPAYLFCEQFCADQRVVDVCPRDEQGATLLSGTAHSVVVVHDHHTRRESTTRDNIYRVIASAESLCFARETFDLAIFSVCGQRANANSINDLLRFSREITRSSGLVALSVPNRDAKLVQGKPDPTLPGFFDLERILRRHFPHVTLFAQRPLHGAVLVPLGRRGSAAAPLLDDRLLPDEGEVPSRYLALCSPRYRKVDESIIAQLPHGAFIERIREQLEQHKGMMTVARAESEARAREIERLEIRTEAMAQATDQFELTKREKTQVEQQLSDARRQLEMRDKLLEDTEGAQNALSEQIVLLEKELHEAKREVRRATQRAQEDEHQRQSSIKEREEAEEERERSLRTLRATRTELKAKQREIDDVREEMAGIEADLTGRTQEASRLRRETVSLKDRTARLTAALEEAREREAESDGYVAELDRLRSVSASDRSQLERQLELTHDQLAEATSARRSAEEQVQNLKAQISAAGTAGQSAKADLETLEERLIALQREYDETRSELKRTKQASSEMSRLAEKQADELERRAHQIEILTHRAEESQATAETLEKKMRALHIGLKETEAELVELRNANKKAAELSQALRNTRLERDALAEENAQLKTASDTLGSKHTELNIARDARLTLEKEISRLKAQIASSGLRDSELRMLKKTNRESEEELIAVKEELASLGTVRDELDEQAEENRHLKEKIASFKQRLDKREDVESELLSARESTHRHRTAAERLDVLLQSAEKKIRTLEADVMGLKIDAASKDDQTQGAIKRANEAAQNASDALEHISALEDALNQSGVERNRANDASDTLRRALEESEEERHTMEAQVRKLTTEMEVELSKVQTDLEMELRQTVSQLDESQGRIWELNDEVLRLRAQVAAMTAAKEQGDEGPDLYQNLVQQEARITELLKEREALHELSDKQRRVLKRRRKSLELLLRVAKEKFHEITFEKNAAPGNRGREKQARPSFAPRDTSGQPPTMFSLRDLRKVISDTEGELADNRFIEENNKPPSSEAPPPERQNPQGSASG